MEGGRGGLTLRRSRQVNNQQQLLRCLVGAFGQGRLVSLEVAPVTLPPSLPPSLPPALPTLRKSKQGKARWMINNSFCSALSGPSVKAVS